MAGHLSEQDSDEVDMIWIWTGHRGGEDTGEERTPMWKGHQEEHATEEDRIREMGSTVHRG